MPGSDWLSAARGTSPGGCGGSCGPPASLLLELELELESEPELLLEPRVAPTMLGWGGGVPARLAYAGCISCVQMAIPRAMRAAMPLRAAMPPPLPLERTAVWRPR